MLVPQTPELTPPARNAAKAYRCRERSGYVWVCLEDPERGIPDLPYADDPDFQEVLEYQEIWNANALRIGENALDLSHVSFVHRVTFGEDDNPVFPKMPLFDVLDGVGIKCEVEVANRDNQRTHRCQFVYRNDTEADAPGADVAAFDRRVAAEDRRFLESTGPDYPLDLHAEAHMYLDRPGIMMRQILSDWPPHEAAGYETAAV